MIRFHPNLVGIILKGRRSKVAKMVHVALKGGGGQGGGPPRVKTMYISNIFFSRSGSRTDLVYGV